jgi:hypothetical protein
MNAYYDTGYGLIKVSVLSREHPSRSVRVQQSRFGLRRGQVISVKDCHLVRKVERNLVRELEPGWPAREVLL